MKGSIFVMAGGGTGGHVIPAIAVARELHARGHRPVFIGTRTGFEAKLVPAAGFDIEWIEIGGLKNVGFARTVRTLAQMPVSLGRVSRLLRRIRPAAVFSMGGYAAGPVVIAALLRRLPVIVMEPNAIPGLTNRRIARFVSRALLSFEETARWFPAGRTEMTGLPVRPEFFRVHRRARGEKLHLLITGGSRGSRTLNNAARQSWPFFRESLLPIRIVHQTGAEAYASVAEEFAHAGVDGEVCPFIQDMPAAFAEADLVVSRSGAGAVSELAAAAMPSILVPFPFAADDHQRKNAEALARAGAARLVPDSEMNGRRLFEEVRSLVAQPGALEDMSANARRFAHPEAARRAADVLEEAASGRGRQ
ncbi:MAG TPA: undecaprenyldiphospho-muramoylpentapeptide beta-N-acetylglucosaminyltransferase [Bryobacteraceae bacterium]|nr:undecaprenyldiphospho-muramoylpentapeptide beta-N-acetylglucosaminyltransferase [Bryobacteraceae bacterium]